MITSVLHSFSYSLDFLRAQVADLSDSDMIAQPHGLANHPAWTLGHLTHSCELLGGVVGLVPWLPADYAARFGTGSVPISDVSRYEPKDRALAILHDAESRIVRAVERLDDSFLEQPFPEESHRQLFPTIRHALTQVMVGHTAHHVGQITAWRKAMRLPPMTRSFE